MIILVADGDETKTCKEATMEMKGRPVKREKTKCRLCFEREIIHSKFVSIMCCLSGPEKNFQLPALGSFFREFIPKFSSFVVSFPGIHSNGRAIGVGSCCCLRLLTLS